MKSKYLKMIEDCIYYGTDGFFMKDQTVKRLVQLLHDFSEELIGENELFSEFDKDIKAKNYLRNRLREKQRKLRDKLLGEEKKLKPCK